MRAYPPMGFLISLLVCQGRIAYYFDFAFRTTEFNQPGLRIRSPDANKFGIFDDFYQLPTTFRRWSYRFVRMRLL